MANWHTYRHTKESVDNLVLLVALELMKATEGTPLEQKLVQAIAHPEIPTN